MDMQRTPTLGPQLSDMQLHSIKVHKSLYCYTTMIFDHSPLTIANVVCGLPIANVVC